MTNKATPTKDAPSGNRRLQKIKTVVVVIPVVLLCLMAFGLAAWKIYQADKEEAATGHHVPRIGDWAQS